LSRSEWCRRAGHPTGCTHDDGWSRADVWSSRTGGMAHVAGNGEPPDDGDETRRKAGQGERGRSVNAPDAAARSYVSSNVLRVRHQPSAVSAARRQVRRELSEENLPEPLLD